MFDENDQIYEIPKDSIIARYYDPQRKTMEDHVYGDAYICCWYNNGELFYSTISLAHNMSFMASTYGLQENEWHLRYLDEITYKEFSKTDWWKKYE